MANQKYLLPSQDMEMANQNYPFDAQQKVLASQKYPKASQQKVFYNQNNILAFKNILNACKYWVLRHLVEHIKQSRFGTTFAQIQFAYHNTKKSIAKTYKQNQYITLIFCPRCVEIKHCLLKNLEYYNKI